MVKGQRLIQIEEWQRSEHQWLEPRVGGHELPLAQFLHQFQPLVLVVFALFMKNTGLDSFNERKLPMRRYKDRVLSIFVSLLIVLWHL